MQRKIVERHIIRPNNVHYQMLKEYCHLAKNLYNHGLYIIRQEFCKNNYWIRYGQLNKILKDDKEYLDYRNMPTAQMAQQVLRNLDSTMSSFFKANKDYKKHPNKYTGRPKLPKYKDKDGEMTFFLTNQNCKLTKDGIIHFPKKFKGFELKTKILENPDYISFQQVKVKPMNGYLIIDVVYRENASDMKEDNNRYLSIDPGLDNFATIVNNIGYPNIILDGKGLKSINRYFNKEISMTKSILMKVNNSFNSKELDRLWLRRKNIIEDTLHKMSRYVINYAKGLDISIIYIGHNKRQKNELSLSKKLNQNFVQIPHEKFNQMLKYKAEKEGIQVIEVEESYTSKASFIDNDFIPTYGDIMSPVINNFNGKRINRGLYQSKEGKLINADVNGALNILRKVKPTAFNKLEVIAAGVSSPLRINFA